MTLLRNKPARNKLRENLYEKLQSSGVPLAETVKTLRKILAKDQASFSKEVGISLSTLRKIEQQGEGISLRTVQAVLDKYELELVVKTKT